jgi:esterase
VQLRTFDVDGYPLTCQESGDGPPLLLVHGSLGDYRVWAAQIGPMAARFRVLAPSLRHCYPERWDGRGDFSVERHAEDLAHLIERHVGEPVHVLGHSRGGAVAIQLASTHNDLVRTLVLADPGGLEALLPDSVEGRSMATESERMFEQLARDLATGDRLAAARAFVESLGGAGAWERRTPAQREMLLDNILTGPACAQRPRFPRALLCGLALPILLLRGARSPQRYAIMLSELQHCNPRVSDSIVIPDAAHAMQRENPDAFNAAVLRFLAGRERA